MAVTVWAPGSCGELAQGVIDGQHFLITCPVDIYSRATIVTGAVTADFSHVKAATAMKQGFALRGVHEPNCQVVILSDLPVGKGMASSSADISAACQAAAAQTGELLTPDEIANLALAIEPTDAIFYPGIMMFDHVAGHLRRFLGAPPPMEIVILDAGGEIDTVAFNNRRDLPALNHAKEKQVRRAAELIIAGMQAGDCRLIGSGATMSAVANQSILYKPNLETIIRIGQEHGAVGVNAAHSGTVLGVLFPAGQGKKDDCLSAIQCQCGSVRYIATARMISGGLIIKEGDDHHGVSTV